MEQPASALIEALRCQELARAAGDSATLARSTALQGYISLHRGDLRSGVRLAATAAEQAQASGSLKAQAEAEALRAVLSLFTGAYTESVAQAHRALGLADRDGDPRLRLFVRRMTTMVFGNLHTERMPEMLALTLELSAGDPREQALSLNDLATHLADNGEYEAAFHELQRAFIHLDGAPQARFSRAVLHVTRAEIRLGGGDPRRALIDSRTGLSLLIDETSPNPYLLGAAIRAQVRGLVAVGDLDAAQELGERTLSALGDRVPQMRGGILSTLAEGLREAGRLEDAYVALTRACELEREAFRDLVELQMSLERTTLEAEAAQRRGDVLMAKNRELAVAHAELESRSREMEALQDQLRDQAERDWLTGLHNRRYLAHQLDAVEAGKVALPVSIAILDLDDFKAINDRFGHATGDRVLVDVARMLQSLSRPSDTVVRSGGEEFTLVMPSTAEWEAVDLGERIRSRLLELRWADMGPQLRVSASIGIGCTVRGGSDADAVVADADRRLFEAKRGGRNRVVSGG